MPDVGFPGPTATRSASSAAHPAALPRTSSGLRARLVRLSCAIALALPLALIFGVARAHGSQVGDIRIEHPFAPPSVPGSAVSVVYVRSMVNEGKAPDRLVRAASPVAGTIQLHNSSMDGGVMRMREVEGGIVLAPGQRVTMRPGAGLHLMLMDMKRPLKLGETFPLTLEFERAGKVDVKVVVQQPTATGATGDATKHGDAHKH